MLPRSLTTPLFARMSERTLRHVDTRDDHPLLERVYEQIGEDYVLGGPITVHSARPALTAGMWMGGREIMLVSDRVDRATKEAVAAGVSVANRCPYCVDMHVSMAHAGQLHDAAEGVRTGELDAIDDPTLRATVAWAMASLDPEDDLVRRPPFPDDQVPELVGTVLFFHYVNRVVNVLFEGSALSAPAFAKGWLLRQFGKELEWNVAHRPRAGTSLSLLPAAALPDDLSWARPSPAIAGALARWVAAVDAAGDEVLLEATRTRVSEVVRGWTGGHPALFDPWLDQALEGLDAQSHAEARLVLLVARASWQVDEDALANFAEYHPEDGDLVAAVAWGAMRAARRIASWLI